MKSHFHRSDGLLDCSQSRPSNGCPHVSAESPDKPSTPAKRAPISVRTAAPSGYGIATPSPPGGDTSDMRSVHFGNDELRAGRVRLSRRRRSRRHAFGVPDEFFSGTPEEKQLFV